MEDFIDIDGFEDDVKDNGLLNKLLDKSFYFILLPSVYNYLDYTDFFIFIRFEGMEKKAIVVIIAMFVTVGTLLVATAETVIMPGKRAIAVITVMLITAGTLLITTAKTTVTLGTRSDQIGLLKNAGSTLSLKVRFCNDVIVIKKLDDIDITALNNKVAMSEITILEIL